MDQLIPGLQVLLAILSPAFRLEAHAMFCDLVAAWIVCLGRRTISRVWETTGQSRQRNHAAAFRLFSQAAWNWDEVCRLLLLRIVATLAVGTRLWIVVDDTLCHKRGAKVAFGGIFLDAVLSTKRHKVFRYGNNWVLLGIIVELPWRQDRYFCLPVLWRVYQKRGDRPKQEHRTKPQLAAEMVTMIAGWFPQRQCLVVGDSGYLGKALLRGRPANVEALGPLCWTAALHLAPAADQKQLGPRLPTPKQLLADDRRWPARRMNIAFKNGRTRRLAVKVVSGVCWPSSAGKQPVQVVLVRDPKGEWRDEALLCTETTLSAREVITGYCRRWSVEVAFCDAKQLLGFHDPAVWCAAAVARAAPMAWFVGALVVLWYAEGGCAGQQAQRPRPWYRHKPTPTFADMLAACRVQLWHGWLKDEGCGPRKREEKLAWLLEYVATTP
jgi:DDE superfamily endonuclease